MKFDPIRTDRLLLRHMGPDDVESLAARRNDPEVARYQAWSMPFPVERARDMVAGFGAMEGPTNDEWWMAAVERSDSGEVIGELVVHLSWEGRAAEIGYTFHPAHWGNGFAVEAATAMVAYLFDHPEITRVFGTLHPDNTPSARVLERVGMLHEGHTRNSFWVGDENSDDWIYGMTPEDHRAWIDRPRAAPEIVTWVPVDHSNAAAVSRLRTHWTQREFVAPVEKSYANALFPEIIDGAPVEPWMRAVHADGELVAFVMLAAVTDAHPEPYLWRLLVDRLHQRRGIGRRILDLVVEQCRSWGAETLVTSWVPDRGTPGPLYLSYGFEPTGTIIDDEVEARLTFG
jgi:RimJ/RimL family protein N-acetyltransferase